MDEHVLCYLSCTHGAPGLLGLTAVHATGSHACSSQAILLPPLLLVMRMRCCCRQLAALYAMYLGRPSCLPGAPKPFFHNGDGSAPGSLATPQIIVEQYLTADGKGYLYLFSMH
jgi:hypothetical protein